MGVNYVTWGAIAAGRSARPACYDRPCMSPEIAVALLALCISLWQLYVARWLALPPAAVTGKEKKTL
jgi:hypothetical protein